MTKSFAQIIAPKITGIAKSGAKFRANVQEIITLTFKHAAVCGDYSALTKLVSVMGSHEKRQVVGYVVEHTTNLKYDAKKQQFKKTSKKVTVEFNCKAIAKVTWHEYAKIADKSLPVNADKMYPLAPAKSHDTKVTEAVSFTGDSHAMMVRRAALAKLEAMSDAELAGFAGINTDNVTKLDVAA